MTKSSELSNSDATIFEVGRLLVSLSFFDRNDLKAYLLVSDETLEVARAKLAKKRYAADRFEMVRKNALNHSDKKLADELIRLIGERAAIGLTRNRLMHDIWSYSRADDAYRLLPEDHGAGDIFPPPLLDVEELKALVKRTQTATAELLTVIVAGQAK